MRNRFLALIALTMCACMLFGCAAPAPAATDAAQPAAEPAAPASAPAPAAEPAAEEEGKLYAFRIGCSDEAYRAENLIAATEMLNEQLAAEGSKDTVSLEYIVVDDFQSTITLWMQENNLPEFIAQTGGTVSDFYKAGAFVDVSYVVNDEVYSSKVTQNLRDMGKSGDEYSGVILDTECRFVIVYKPALQKLGWTDEQIESWKADARAGKITTKDLQDVAKQVVDAGICEYGITHRPNKGADWRYTFITWNHGEIPVNEQGQVVISRQNIIDFLTYWRENVQLGLTPYNHLTDFNWDMLEGDIWPNGKSFCWYGQIASKGDMMNAGGVSSDYVNENYFSIPLPVSKAGDRPVSGSNPYFYALTTASQADEKTAEYCRRILDNVLDPKLQLNSSLYETHLAITDETIALPEYQADAWMLDAAYLNDYMYCLPSNQYLSMYGNSQEMFDAIQMAELQANDPKGTSIEEITDDLIAKITFNMGDGNFVLVD